MNSGSISGLTTMPGIVTEYSEKKPKSETSENHRLYPVVTLASHGNLHVHAHITQDIASVLIVLTVEAVDVSLFMQVAAADHIHSGKPMSTRTGDDEMLLEKLQRVVPILDAFRQAIDRHLDRTFKQPGIPSRTDEVAEPPLWRWS
jgi:hypothetical protein